MIDDDLLSDMTPTIKSLQNDLFLKSEFFLKRNIPVPILSVCRIIRAHIQSKSAMRIKLIELSSYIYSLFQSHCNVNFEGAKLIFKK